MPLSNLGLVTRRKAILALKGFDYHIRSKFCSKSWFSRMQSERGLLDLMDLSPSLENSKTPASACRLQPSELQGRFQEDKARFFQGRAIPTPREHRVHANHPIARLNVGDSKTTVTDLGAEEPATRIFDPNPRFAQGGRGRKEPARDVA